MSAVVTLKLTPAEFKLVQIALKVAEVESGAAAQTSTDPRQKRQSREEQARFADLYSRLS